ncbi:hypothetical protein [Kineococcus glutinatus]|uniref:Uncharacterized protein n=1 Tax=Kineococcus glutinatus TaxID=1070872 RepID=A0ABP9HNL8_9ACTN
MEHFDEARAIWKAYVPRSGQAETVQGELLRAVEKLRDEAQRNGNGNWDSGFVILIGYLRSVLTVSEAFDAATTAVIEQDLDRLLHHESPEVADEPYDRLTDRVVEWCRLHREPVPHERNPRLHR